MPDLNNRPYALEATTKVGDILIADAGFTCICAGDRLRVASDDDGLYVMCQGPDLDVPTPGAPYTRRHYLEGQLNDAGEYVGLYLEYDSAQKKT